MYKLTLGVGWNALKTRFQSYDDNPLSADWKRIDQHKILLNKVIIQYYIEQAKADGVNTDIVMAYINKIFNNRQRSEAAKAKGETVDLVFGNYFADKDDEEGAILYAADDLRCSKNKCKYQFDFTAGIFEDEKNLISLYSVKNNVTLYPGDKVKKYLAFIRHMLEGEKEISFIDPFIAGNDDARREFLNVYLPMIAEGAVVNVFLAKTEGMIYWPELKEAAKNRNIRLLIYPCRKDTMHDRFITTSDSVLNIGAGILFYNSQKEVREVSTFGYKKKDTAEGIEYEIGLAGGNVERPQ